MKFIFFPLLAAMLFLFGCSGGGFDAQIKKDIVSKMSTGICDSIPSGAAITNIVVGDIVPIEGMGMTDVTIDFDYEKDGIIKHHTGALLYLTQGGRKRLGAIGGCEWEPNFLKKK